eukprot:Polyplicarium_translucidae@DN3398_c3_g1_i6.p3
MPPSMPCPNSAALCWAWKIRIVHKASLLKFPLLGTMFRLAQELPIAFEDGNGGTSPQAKPESASQLMERVRYLHTLGIAQLVFPEGTRFAAQQKERLGYFRNGFFRLASETGCEILPAVVHNTEALWPVGKMWPFGATRCVPGTCYIAFGDPFRPEIGTPVEAVRERARNQMLGLLDECFPIENDRSEGADTTADAAADAEVASGRRRLV